jgi:hypothetical protein
LLVLFAAKVDTLVEMSSRIARVFLATAALSAAAAAPAAAGWSSHANEVSTLRAQATRFITAELAGDGATVCAVLNSPNHGVGPHQTCAGHWDAALRTLLRTPGARRRLTADLHAVAGARVTLTHGDYVGSLALPTPLLGSSSEFYWTNNCWMLER